MGKHHERVVCPNCFHYTEPAYDICPRCVNEHRGLVILYNEILQERPQYKNLSAPQLFRKMWEVARGQGAVTRKGKRR